jgi:hypothetical protein
MHPSIVPQMHTALPQHVGPVEQRANTTSHGLALDPRANVEDRRAALALPRAACAHRHTGVSGRWTRPRVHEVTVRPRPPAGAVAKDVGLG